MLLNAARGCKVLISDNSCCWQALSARGAGLGKGSPWCLDIVGTVSLAAPRGVINAAAEKFPALGLLLYSSIFHSCSHILVFLFP